MGILCCAYYYYYFLQQCLRVLFFSRRPLFPQSFAGGTRPRGGDHRQNHHHRPKRWLRFPKRKVGEKSIGEEAEWSLCERNNENNNENNKERKKSTTNARPRHWGQRTTRWNPRRFRTL